MYHLNMKKSKIKLLIEESPNKDIFLLEYENCKKLLKANGLPEGIDHLFINFIEYDVIDNIPSRVLKIKQLGYSHCKEKSILKYGEEEGIKRWESYRERQAYTNSLDYFKEKGKSEKDFKKYNKSRGITFENLILKYGEEEGIKRWESYRERQAYTNSLDYFKEKLGIEEGLIFFKNLNKRKALTIDNFILKYGEEEGIKRFSNLGTKNKFASKESNDILSKIDLEIGTIETSYFASKNKEFGSWDKKNKKYYFYDFICTKNKICIEYNGSYWHMNPKFYKPEDINQTTKILAQDIWDYDKQKNNHIKKLGYKVFVIWDKDNLNEKIRDIKNYVREKRKY